MKLTDLLISERMSIKEAISRLDETARKILVVSDGNGKLCGTITDGDIRRWILRSGDLRSSVSHIMSKSPKFVRESERSAAPRMLREWMIEALPVVNQADEVVDIVFWNDNFHQTFNRYDRLDTPVVIMAGGKGTRLAPYTNIIPKPLIPIGDQTIIERIMDRFVDYGCSRFYLTVNYKKNMIRAYFNELEDKRYAIDYVEEDTPLGTAGSLSLLDGMIKETLFVSNCDILIDGNYSEMLAHHKAHKNKITIITSLKHYAIPYGVVEIDTDSRVRQLSEKPEYDLLVNTGMYILEPETLADIPPKTFYHITDLINLYLERGEKVGIYPVSDKAWLDMGQLKEMENMLERLGIKA